MYLLISLEIKVWLKCNKIIPSHVIYIVLIFFYPHGLNTTIICKDFRKIESIILTPFKNVFKFLHFYLLLLQYK